MNDFSFWFAATLEWVVLVGLIAIAVRGVWLSLPGGKYAKKPGGFIPGLLLGASIVALGAHML